MVKCLQGPCSYFDFVDMMELALEKRLEIQVNFLKNLLFDDWQTYFLHQEAHAAQFQQQNQFRHDLLILNPFVDKDNIQQYFIETKNWEQIVVMSAVKQFIFNTRPLFIQQRYLDSDWLIVSAVDNLLLNSSLSIIICSSSVVLQQQYSSTQRIVIVYSYEELSQFNKSANDFVLIIDDFHKRLCVIRRIGQVNSFLYTPLLFAGFHKIIGFVKDDTKHALAVLHPNSCIMDLLRVSSNAIPLQKVDKINTEIIDKACRVLHNASVIMQQSRVLSEHKHWNNMPFWVCPIETLDPTPICFDLQRFVSLKSKRLL